MFRLETPTSFWMAEVNDEAFPDATLCICWGSLGTAGESKKQVFKGRGKGDARWDEAYASATTELERLLAEKRGEGYVDKGEWEEKRAPAVRAPAMPTPTKVEPSLRAYLKSLAVSAWARADQSLDADRYDGSKNALGDLDDLARDYWEADYRWLFLTACAAVDDEYRESGAVRKLVDEAHQLFRAEFVNEPDYVALGAADQESFLNRQEIFSGSKVVRLKSTFDPHIKVHAAKDAAPPTATKTRRR